MSDRQPINKQQIAGKRDLTLVRLEIVLCMLAEDPELLRILSAYLG